MLPWLAFWQRSRGDTISLEESKALSFLRKRCFILCVGVVCGAFTAWWFQSGSTFFCGLTWLGSICVMLLPGPCMVAPEGFFIRKYLPAEMRSVRHGLPLSNRHRRYFHHRLAFVVLWVFPAKAFDKKSGHDSGLVENPWKSFIQNREVRRDQLLKEDLRTCKLTLSSPPLWSSGLGLQT